MTPKEFNATLLDPIYDGLGVPARLLCGSGKSEIDVPVLDKTHGVTVLTGGQFKTETIAPVAVVRLAELAENNVAFSDLSDGQLRLGVDSETERTWRIASSRKERGEAWLILQEQARNE